jgi:hypothetical protein
MKAVLSFFICLCFLQNTSYAQQQRVTFIKSKSDPAIHVHIGGKPFTDFFFSDTIAKPVLYPIKAPNGNNITRGFPVAPVAGEPTDHPHHLGLWFNYGDVNGLDFWNNSFAVPSEKKHLYGHIRFGKITSLKGGPVGILSYVAYWNDNDGHSLLKEKTSFKFTELHGNWVIDRTTTLAAVVPVFFKDNKEGLFGLRMAHELKIPSSETKKFVDGQGIETIIKISTDTIANGNYINSNGVYGEAVWGKQATWCMMYAKMHADSVSVLIIDHPQNIGYPTFWHARGYGLFSANPLGAKVFTNGATERNLSLKANEEITIRYRLVIASGKKVISKESIKLLEQNFASTTN